MLALVALVMGNMIGAGIFTTSGFALADLHTPGRVMMAWLVGGLLAACGAIGYGALVRRLTESGGEYLFLSRLVHPAVGFLAGWVSLLAGFTAAIAFAAVTCEVYLIAEDGRPPWLPEGVLATAMIFVCATLHGGFKRLGSQWQTVLVLVKGLLLVAFLCLAAKAGASESAGEAVAEVPPFSMLDFAKSLMWISLSFAGFNAAVYVAGESKTARRTVPRALWIGTGLVTLLYLALNAAFLYVPSLASVRGEADIAVIAAQAMQYDGLVTAVRLVIALALLTSVSAMIQAGPRVYARMAQDGVFPKGLRFDGESTPRTAIVLQAALAILVVWVSDLQQLLSYLGFTLSLSSAGAVACVFILHRQAPIAVGVRLAAALYVGATVGIAVLGALRSPWAGVVGVATALSGLLVYRLMSRRA